MSSSWGAAPAKIRTASHRFHLTSSRDNGTVGSEDRADLLVVFIEGAGSLVQYLEHPDQGFVYSRQRHREQAARSMPGLAVHVWIKPRIGIAVRHVDEAACLCSFSRDSLVRGETNDAGGSTAVSVMGIAGVRCLPIPKSRQDQRYIPA